jgi:hypothetical protein
MVSRGERELRGERRGKGGRSLLATAAPFFFICQVFAAPAAGQRVEVYGRAGLAGSTALATDLVADESIPNAIGAPVDEDVRAVPAPGLTVGAGVRIGFWPRATLGLDAAWMPTELQAKDGSGTRPIQDLTVLQTIVSASWAVRRGVELGAGAGFIWYRTEETGLFAGGNNTSPVLEVSAGWTPDYWNGRLALIAAAQTHRFGTPVLSGAGAQDGSVTRLSLSGRVRLVESGR